MEKTILEQELLETAEKLLTKAQKAAKTNPDKLDAVWLSAPNQIRKTMKNHRETQGCYRTVLKSESDLKAEVMSINNILNDGTSTVVKVMENLVDYFKRLIEVNTEKKEG